VVRQAVGEEFLRGRTDISVPAPTTPDDRGQFDPSGDVLRRDLASLSRVLFRTTSLLDPDSLLREIALQDVSRAGLVSEGDIAVRPEAAMPLSGLCKSTCQPCREKLWPSVPARGRKGAGPSKKSVPRCSPNQPRAVQLVFSMMVALFS
jgi:hypothetical protein